MSELKICKWSVAMNQYRPKSRYVETSKVLNSGSSDFRRQYTVNGEINLACSSPHQRHHKPQVASEANPVQFSPAKGRQRQSKPTTEDNAYQRSHQRLENHSIIIEVDTVRKKSNRENLAVRIKVEEKDPFRHGSGFEDPAISTRTRETNHFRQKSSREDEEPVIIVESDNFHSKSYEKRGKHHKARGAHHSPIAFEI